VWKKHGEVSNDVEETKEIVANGVIA